MIPSLRAVRRDADEVEILDALLGALASGVPLPEACGDAAAGAQRAGLRRRFAALRDALVAGTPLGDALATAGASPGLVAAARAGEASGRLAETLAAHEDSIEWRLEMQRRTWDAWAQPLLSLGVAAATVVLLAAVGAFPLLVALLDRPGPSARLLGGLAALPQPLPVLLAVAILAVIPLGTLLLLRGPRGQRFLERLPLAGGARREQQRALALREAAALVRGGVPAQDALALAGAGQPSGSSTRSAMERLSFLLSAGDASAQDVDWPLLQALLHEPPPAAELADVMVKVSRWHEAERDRLADAASRAATILAVSTAALGCGAVTILAWGGYFDMVSRIGG